MKPISKWTLEDLEHDPSLINNLDAINPYDYSIQNIIPSTSPFGKAYEATIAPKLITYLKPRGSFVFLAILLEEKMKQKRHDTPMILIGVKTPDEYKNKEDERLLRNICGCEDERWSGPIIGIFPLVDSDHVETSFKYSEMNNIRRPLETYYEPLGRDIAITDEQLFHQHIGLGCSIGPLFPDIKPEDSSTSSHGIFMKDKDGDIYGISTCHGFLDTTKQPPEFPLKQPLISPSFDDVLRVQHTIKTNKSDYQNNEAVARQNFEQNPEGSTGRRLNCLWQRSKIVLHDIESLESKTLELLNNPQKAQFAELSLGRYTSDFASDLDGTHRNDNLYHEMVDYCLYKLTNPSRYHGNISLEDQNSKQDPIQLIQDLILDNEVQLNSRALGTIYGSVSGVAIYEYNTYTNNNNDQFKNKIFRHNFVMIPSTATKQCFKQNDSVLLSARGSSGGAWIDYASIDPGPGAVGLHRSSRRIPHPQIILDDPVRREYIAPVLGELEETGINAGQITMKNFPRWSKSTLCEISVISNLCSIVRDAKRQGFELEDIFEVS